MCRGSPVLDHDTIGTIGPKTFKAPSHFSRGRVIVFELEPDHTLASESPTSISFHFRFFIKNKNNNMNMSMNININNCNCNSMPLSQLPSLPPLYFDTKGASLSANSLQNNDAVLELPVEVLHQCLTAFADWGDLAKLACVQSNWSHALYDAADTSAQSKWELAQALFQGTHGLRANPTQAMQLFLELANIPVDKVTNMPLSQDSKTEAGFAPAMKQISQCYFTGAGVAAIDTSVGLAWLKAAHTAAGDVGAAHEVALVYEYGQYGVENDIAKATEWFHMAADADQRHYMQIVWQDLRRGRQMPAHMLLATERPADYEFRVVPAF
jgi:hypothetical protein